MSETRYFLCIDLKSFYASVECVDRGLNPFAVPLVVADRSRGKGSIVLAVSPYLRKFNVPSRLRIYELPERNDIIFATPRMSRYLEVSAEIVGLYLDFVAEDDLHIYSVDECFLDVTHYLAYHKKDAYTIAVTIKKRILTEFGLTCTIGIGPNMLLSKVAMDIESKHTETGIAYWTEKDIPEKVWTIAPLNRFWGIGAQYQRKLNSIGIYTVGDLAHYPKKLLIDKFGIIGGQMHDHANGIDTSSIREKFIPEHESFSSGQVLMRDYTSEEIPLILEETLDDLILRLHYHQKLCRGIYLSVRYSASVGGGFAHQIAFINPTDNFQILKNALNHLFRKYVQNKPIRKITVTLTDIRHSDYYQTDLFSSPEELEKQRRLLYTLSKIKEKYGKNAVLRASAKNPHSTIEERHGQIGGHRK